MRRRAVFSAAVLLIFCCFSSFVVRLCDSTRTFHHGISRRDVSSEKHGPTTANLVKSRRRPRHSGRLLGRPKPAMCTRRPKQFVHEGHAYFLSEDSPRFRGQRVSWLDARNLCRERCMDLVSIETFEENMLVSKLVHQRGLRDVWTSGRLCNFKGCDAKHLQPKHINGERGGGITCCFYVPKFEWRGNCKIS